MNSIENLRQTLLAHYGPLKWWPGETPFEISVGAILTQNTNWKNVEKAIHGLKQNNTLNAESIYLMDISELAEAIKPAGYFNQKARKLKIFSEFLVDNHSGKIEIFMSSASITVLRKQLLSLWGIGPETADSILLYAGNKEIFVIDAYTKRIFSRHRICKENIDYETLRLQVEISIEKNHYSYNEFHAGLVNIAKEFCRKKNPQCGKCPLNLYK